jgi:hypothetical protein
MIGKDITKFAVPVHFNEPLSMLQKQAEAMEYHDILTKAYSSSDPALRLLHIAAFNIAQYYGTFDRLTKPYNPILGETYELKTSDYKYISE